MADSDSEVCREERERDHQGFTGQLHQHFWGDQTETNPLSCTGVLCRTSLHDLALGCGPWLPLYTPVLASHTSVEIRSMLCLVSSIVPCHISALLYITSCTHWILLRAYAYSGVRELRSQHIVCAKRLTGNVDLSDVMALLCGTGIFASSHMHKRISVLPSLSNLRASERF